MSPLPSTMKVVHQPDPKSVHLVLDDGPLPTLSHPEDCLIRIYTASPCLGELHWEENFPSLFEPGRERVPCTEAAGVIVQAPPPSSSSVATCNQRPFKPGDHVFFRVEPSMTGNLRQYSVARTSQLAHKPSNLGWVEAGATPLSALTAWQGIFDQSALDPRGLFGDVGARRANASLRVLVTGASGVVGGWAVQLAALAGAGAVVAYAGGRSSAEHVRGLGATEVIDYKEQSLTEWVAQDPEGRAVDAILDCVGGVTLGSCWHAVKDGGFLLSVASDPAQVKPEDVGEKKLSASKWFLVEPKGSQLAQIATLMEQGKCVTKVDSAVDFEDFQTAFDKVEQKTAKGKVVIKVSQLNGK
ncbi:alcohol dehydrogenase zinc-binding domain-containing protein [Beauveria bassiana ARSEF 2860]|uniref:Alcohol dehydrogenase zinc-binding domain-containing protein n=1 Tax=Beauveria bassiana (strain ARSEF 2860) TaxID=655819 RepID=J5K1D6_BEAB2|nr:alcohol dehydrogenase zinc-binding domain-containing protein [Beauveria bassiana ARSEF 2860]EJP68031.1 alcohol dehydrogenase zinc-binding domain-containing protein [Beauveria bassiana ARSEF 2860]